VGYTHYWRHSSGFEDQQWAAIVKDVAKIFATTNVPLADGLGKPGTKPEITEKDICFNGVEPDDYETFHLTRAGDDFSFCKTRGDKPYDEVVCAVLIVAAHHAPERIKVSSDGDAGDWVRGLDLVRVALGTGYSIPLKK
jgi:hypothetical protein